LVAGGPVGAATDHKEFRMDDVVSVMNKTTAWERRTIGVGTGPVYHAGTSMAYAVTPPFTDYKSWVRDRRSANTAYGECAD
jgi:hypothetical protein